MLEKIEKPELDTVICEATENTVSLYWHRWNVAMVSPLATVCGVCCSPHCPVWL